MTLSFNADRETKKLTRKQVKDLESVDDLETIKQNSLEPQKFKRVSLGGHESRDVELYAFHEEAKYLLALPLC